MRFGEVMWFGGCCDARTVVGGRIGIDRLLAVKNEAVATFGASSHQRS